MSLESQILSAIKEKPGIKGKDLAFLLNVDKKQINHLLYGKLKGRVRQDNAYLWYPVAKDSAVLSSDINEYTTAYADTPLSRLCRYYLSCLGQDESGISVFAANRHGDLDYSEIRQLPLNSQWDIFSTEAASNLLGKMRKDRSRLGMYLGYPTTLKHVVSKKGWKGYFVEPVLLFPVEFGDDGKGAPKLDLSYPIINQSVLKRYSNADGDSLMDELVQLEDELGFSGDNATIELDELVQRLKNVRPEWPWKEEIEPDTLRSEPPLSEIDEAGIFNRAVLITAERSPFTQGLESELKSLANLKVSDYENTALGQWVSGKIPEKSVAQPPELVEVLPLNTEQRQSIKHALSSPLAVITGPPGTGKSQVVTDLLINCAWHNKRVVFASKNNRAVDVVETRINALGSRPILLRVGSRAYQTRLAEYLMGLLSATVTQEDRQEFDEYCKDRDYLEQQLKKLDKDVENVINLRNTVDELERSAEEARNILPPKVKSRLKTIDIEKVRQGLDVFKVSLDSASLDKQKLISRTLWWAVKKKRFQVLQETAKNNATTFKELSISLPNTVPNDDSIIDWQEFANNAEEIFAQVEMFKKYLSTLAHLQQISSLQDIYKEQTELIDKLSKNAEMLWGYWLRLQPANLSRKDRNMLSSYKAILRMVIETGPDEQLGRDIYRKYHSLFSEVSHLLPCWAVTSLSTKGKLPFKPGFFDIAVFDEASQCDIASALPLLYRAKQAVIIGDPKQLSHISAMQRGQDQQFIEKFDLADYANWAYSYNSLFDLASSLSAGEDIISLRDHHRSHADIIEFSNKYFYEGRLRVATHYEKLNRKMPKEPGVRWIDIKGMAVRPASGGALNETEVQAVVQVLHKLIIDQGYTGSVGVVSPFRAQANAIRRQVENNQQLAEELIKHDFLSDTVHKFQGDERDVMIFSPVIAEGITPGSLGFLRNNGNLFNVAITRARAMLLVVGDQQFARNSDVDYLAKFAVYAQELKTTETQQIAHEQDDLGAEYPAVVHPDRVSDWERIFYKALYAKGIKTLPQYQVEKYALDLALFDGERRLEIEVDGERYHRSWTGELCRRDQIRNHRMFELGWDVMRLWVYEIRDDMDGCIRRIKTWEENKEVK